MSLIKQSWRRATQCARSAPRGVETGRLSPAKRARIAGLFAAAAVVGLAAAEQVGSIDGFDFCFAAACVSAAAIFATIVLDRVRAAPAAEPRVEAANGDVYRTLCRAAGDLIMHHDADGQVISADAEGRQYSQIDVKHLLGSGYFSRVHVADRPEFLRALNSALHDEQSASATLRLRSGAVERSPNGLEPVFVWTQMRICRLRPASVGTARRGEAALVSMTRGSSDATEVQQRLEAARAEAVLAVSLKDRLLANVSHELRTPLNAILGFSEILADPQLSPQESAKRFEYARIVHSSAEHLLSVVNLVLDMSKIEAGKFEILPEPFEWEPLVKDCCDMLRLRAESGKVALVSTGTDAPAELVADKRACRQILLNLLSNAVKFTPPEGRVAIGAQVADSAIHIHVSDTGIGIAARDLPHLGEPFFQARSNYDRSYEGAGLGLSLVRGLVGLHGGTVRLESAPGAGTRVTVTLPLDCRSVPSAGGGAPRLETFASFSASAQPDALHERSRSSFKSEERKIA